MEFATNKITEKALQDCVFRSSMHNIPHSEWKPGMVVMYLLQASQLPIYPEKEWRGKIKKVYTSIDALDVEILNRGYEGIKERVYFEQIVRVESEEQQ